MARRTEIREGMVVKSRSGEPLGRVLSVDEEGFVLERRVVVTREFHVGREDVEETEDGDVILARVPAGAERVGLETEVAREVGVPRVEAVWSSRHAGEEARREQSGAWRETGRTVVAVTERAGAYPVQVESGSVPSPRYTPWSEEEERGEDTSFEEEPAPTRH